MEALSNELVLVTGASGFIASQVVKQLLECGARVRGTVRDTQNEKKVGFLRNLAPGNSDRLELVKADLLEADAWKSAVANCKYVLHVASPFPLGVPNDPDDLIKPAVEGTLNVLRACAEERSVKRVVVTSSVLAVYDASLPMPKDFEANKTLTEECWTDGNNTNLDPYSRSKALAEKTAWDFVKELPEDKKFELSTVLPGLVFGPLLSTSDSTSVSLVTRLLERSMPAVPRLMFPLTDVRDVAQAHLKALVTDEAQGHRHLVVTESVWMKQVALILHKEFKPQGYSVPTMTVPNFLVYISSLLQREYRAVVPRLGREHFYSNQRLREVLKVIPTGTEKIVLDTANSVIDLGMVKARCCKKANSKPNAEEVAAEQTTGHA